MVLAFAACSKSAPAAASSDTQATPAAGQATPATPAPPAETAPKPVPAQLPDVVARVNGEAISRADLEMAVSEIEARAGQPMPANQRDRVLRAVLDQLIGYKLLVQETAARKTNVPDAEVDARMAQIRSQ